MVVVPKDDRDQVDQGMGGQEPGTRDSGRLVSRPPGSRGQCESGDNEDHANVLDEMRVERPGSGGTRGAGVPERAGKKHCQSVEESRYSENCRYCSPHWGLLRTQTSDGPQM